MKIIKSIWTQWTEENGEMKIFSLGYAAYCVGVSILIYLVFYAYDKL